MSRVSSEEVELLSNEFGKMGRDRGSNHYGLLFGSETVAENGWDDLNELREEDIWGEEETSSWDRLLLHQKKDTYPVPQPIKEKKASTKAGRRSWLSMELQTADQKNDQGRTGFCAGSNDQGNHGGKKEINGGFSARKVNIPQYGNGGGGGYSSNAMAKGGVPQSAPVSIPVWAKCHTGGEPVMVTEGDEDENGDGYEDEEADARLPPHEIVARECARSQSTTFSVFEGTGRTLKGMDLRRVRNAVWRRTGFLD